VFLGPQRDDYPAKPHDPPFGLWIAPAFLAFFVVLIGIAPFLAEPLVNAAAGAVTGAPSDKYLSIWHGVTPALIMSIIAVLGGLLLLALHAPLMRLWNATPRPEAKVMFDAVVAAVVALVRSITYGLHNGSMSRYLAIFVAATVALGYAAWSGGGHLPATRAIQPIPPVVAVGWLMLIVSTATVVILHRQRFRALVVIGVLGLMISSGFVYLSAPDLALTQISVETVTIMLLLLALYFLPKDSPLESSAARRVRDGVIALVAGGAVTALAMAFMLRDVADPISAFHLENAKTGGGGTNVVNVILVDFRGYDTYGEIIVLGIAGLAIFALMDAVLNGPASRRLRNMTPVENRARDRHPMMMVVATRAMMPIAVVVGAYFFLRGHNQPGGGFVAGLVISIALLMQYMASGFAWAQSRQRIEYHAMIGWGALIAGLTGVGSWLFGKPFLTSDFGYFEIPPIEEFELATALLFDLGVFLTVLGSVMLMLYSLSRMARYAGETVNTEPMDYDPSRNVADTTGKES